MGGGGLTALFVLVAGAVPAQAGLITFFGEDLNPNGLTRLTSSPNSDAARNSFLSNLVGVGTESFESTTPGNYSSLNLTFPGAGTATLTGAITVYDLPTGNITGGYPTDGNRFVYTSSNLGITFDSPVAAFGFKGTDIGDINGQLILTFTGGGTQTINVPNSTSASANGAILFFGVIGTSGTTFSSVQFSNTAAGSDFFGFDQMTIGSQQQVVTLPEPSATAMTLTGMSLLGGGIGWLRRRVAGTPIAA